MSLNTTSKKCYNYIVKEDTNIIEEIKKGRNIVILGPSGSGKTYWVKDYFIPKLQELGKKVNYFEDGFSKDLPSVDISIFDEAETLLDYSQLQNKYIEDKPYYSKKYLEEVNFWHELYKKHPEQSVYIISRKKSDINFLVENFNKTDWDNRDIKVFEFLN